MKPLLLAALFSLMSTLSTAKAGYLHLCPPAQAPAGVPRASLPGAQETVAAASRAQLPGCRAVPLGVDASLVEALHPLPAGERPAATILLYGPAGQGRFAPSNHELPQPDRPDAPPARRLAPLRANLLLEARVRPFGIEERVRVEHGGGKLRLKCAAGRRAAGVLLEGPWQLPLADLQLQASYTASGAFSLEAADAASIAKESAHALGEMAAGTAARNALLPLPAALDRAGWRQFVLLCPENAASLALESLALVPAAARPTARAAWIWERAQWQDEGEALLAWAGREGIRELFIVVPLDGPQVREPARLAAFVRRAGAAGIAVTSVEGDPHMVLPAQRAATVDRVRAYAAYNRAAAPGERLRAMQFDVEPYLLPGHVLAPGERDREFLAMAHALHAQAGGTRLEFVVPFWWGDKRELLASLAGAADGLAVMDYRTDPGDIIRFAMPFLDWGAAHGKRVHIALEAGPVDAERQRNYVRAGAGEAGELLLAQAGDAQVLVLLRQGVKEAALPRWRLGGERLLDGSATSFHGQRERLRALLPRLERDFGAWRGFGGIALHGWR
jgi:hypothetical protein